MDAAYITRWNGVVRGREAQALAVLGESLEFWEKMAADGKCDPPQVYGGPTGNGMKIIHGDPDQLAQLIASDEYTRILTKVQFVAEEWDYGIWLTGDAMNEQLGQWMEIGKELGVIGEAP